MSSFGYQVLYPNGLNSNSQLRRSTDMVYQRGGTYEVVLTGDTYFSSMELDVDLYCNDIKVGRMALVPYQITSGDTYSYKFNIRPYTYLSNYIQSQHYQFYWLNDWYSTTQQINLNNPYPNIAKVNFKYGYRYTNGTNTFTEGLFHNYNHFTDVGSCPVPTLIPSGFTNTGNYFNYLGGEFQMDNNFILQNFDQEIGTTIGTGITLNTLDVNRGLSPMSQFLMDYPTVPEQSETSRFLSEAPRIQYVQVDENYVLYYLNGQTGDRQVIEADFAVFEFYDVNNTLVTSFNQQLNFAGTAYASPTGFTDTLTTFALPCGPVDIEKIFATINFDDVAYYRVQLFYGYPTNVEYRNSAGPIGPVSEAFYFYLYNNCLPESTRLVWLNSRGGYDYFTFRSYRQDTSKIDRQSYDSRYYATNLASPDRNIGRTNKTFNTEITQEIVLETEYLNVPYSNWLQEMFMSPQVYIMSDDFVSKIDRQDKIYKALQPVQILSTQVDKFNKHHQKLNKYRITMKTGDNFFVSKGF